MKYTYEELLNKNWNIPKTCPACNHPLIYTGSRVYCSNPNCSSALIHRIDKWVRTLDVKNLGPALQQFMVDNGFVKELADLYDLNVQHAVEEAWGVNASKAFTDLNSKKMLPLEKIIGGFDIEGFGVDIIKTLIDAGYDTLEAISQLTISDLIKINGWSDIRAIAFIDGFAEVKDQIQKVANIVGIYIKLDEGIIDNPLQGMHVCVTGKLNNYSRKEIEAAIREVGGIMDSSVTSKTNILCTNDQTSGSSKLKNAAKYGTKIIDEAALIEMLKVI